MIKKFSCNNFRNIQADQLQFNRINLMIGPNNAGKSNFIRALTFFSEMLKRADEGNLKSAFLNAIARHGWKHVLNKQANSSDPIEFSWEIDLEGEPIQYDFSFGVGDTIEDCNILLEKLSSANQPNRYARPFNYFSCHSEKVGEGMFSSATKKGLPNKRLNFIVNSKETIVRQFKDILLGDKKIYGTDDVRVNIAELIYKLGHYFNGVGVYATSKFDTRKMCEPASTKSLDTALKYDASNFINVFNRYKAKDILWGSRFVDKMQELIHGLKTADTVMDYDKLIFRLAYKDNMSFDLSDISEGTLKAMILNLLINMNMESNQSLLAIDEPETNLHPAWQKIVGNWLQTSDTFKQCFISTHSPDFLDSFTEKFKQEQVAVFVFPRNGMIKKVLYNNIKDELGDWELGDLYRTADPALGGWPW